MPVRTSTVLTEVLRGFSQSLQTTAGAAPQVGHDGSVSNSMQFICHHSTLYRQDTDSVVSRVGF
jgi:hypothetical protein